MPKLPVKANLSTPWQWMIPLRLNDTLIFMRIGIDLGGTKIEAIGLDSSGNEIARLRTPTPSGDYQQIIGAVVELVAEIESSCCTQGTVGIGTPGAISNSTGLLKNSNSTCLNGKPLDSDLESALKRPVRLANDANCFALSEAIDGAAAGNKVVLGVILGTGVGGGIVIKGNIITGTNSIAGEWGHNPLPWFDEQERPGQLCYCGKYDCNETFLSGSGLRRNYQVITNTILSAEEISILAEKGDEAAQHALSTYENNLACGLASIINVLDPQTIVLGGGLSNIDRLYENVPKLWDKFTFSDSTLTRLVKAKHGDSSGVRGAAWLWPTESNS